MTYAPGFMVEHFIKDMEITLAEARRMDLALPGLALAHELYLALRAQGGGRDGTQSLIRALARISAVDWARGLGREQQLVVVVGRHELEADRGVEAERAVVLDLDLEVDVVAPAIELVLADVAQHLPADAVAAQPGGDDEAVDRAAARPRARDGQGADRSPCRARSSACVERSPASRRSSTSP